MKPTANQPERSDIPRIIIAALRGGSGKTILSIGIIAAWSKQGKSIAPFKKGPDYIDAGWLALAAGRPCYNLDAFLLNKEVNFRSFLSHAVDADIAVIEGNRGLYDGIDLEGSTSTAELAKLLRAPVVLCVDCTKITRTMAAVISGCLNFDPDVMLKGVILNHVAGSRHEQKLRKSIEHYCGVPVIGAIPKLGTQHFPERHLGLVPTPEHAWARDSIEAVSQIAARHVNLDALADITRNIPGPGADDSDGSTLQLLEQAVEGQKADGRVRTSRFHAEAIAPRIGIMKDSAFQFYYPENIEALAQQGAQIVFVSPLTDQTVPELDALYIGGGFPETHAEKLAENKRFSEKLKALAEQNFPIYAECGGLMYLGEALILDGKPYPMVGIFPLTFDFYKRPQGHGYTIVEVERENPYFKVGTEIKGHEFHYSRVSKWSGNDKQLVFRMKRGTGLDNEKDGILHKQVLATYIHIHALGTPEWAPALFRNAIRYKNSKK